jgi:hypothetical protein
MVSSKRGIVGPPFLTAYHWQQEAAGRMLPACYLPHWQEPFTTAQPDMQHRASSGDMHVPSHSTPPHQLPFLEHIPARQHLPSSYGMQLPLHSTPHDPSERVHPPKSSQDPAEQSIVVTKKTKAKLITRNNMCITSPLLGDLGAPCLDALLWSNGSTPTPSPGLL